MDILLLNPRLLEGYAAYVPDEIAALDPPLPASVTGKIERAARAAIELDSSPGIAGLEPVARLLLRAESVASSRIEGLRVSHRRLEETVFEPKAARGVALSVVRNIEAMNAAVELGMRIDALRVEDLCAIQATLLNTERDRHIAGVVRDVNQLSACGVVRQVTIGRRNRTWAAGEVFDLLDEFDFGMASQGDLERPARPAPTRHRRPKSPT